MASEHALLERMDRTLERIDQHLGRGNELFEKQSQQFELNTQQFELNKEVLGEVLVRTGENHRQVMKRLDDIGVHMRQQTEGLMQVLDRLE
ncbi:MAG: hypothetical protein ACXWED_03025 [Solirubrobacterales bacterium]